MSLNVIVILGRITNNPELRNTTTGTSVCTFTVAVERKFSGKGEERKSDFFTCVAWKNAAEFVTNYFKKGDSIAVSGRLETRKYKDKNEVERTAYEIICDTLSFAGSKAKGDGGDTAAKHDTEQGEFEEVGTADDLPF